MVLLEEEEAQKHPDVKQCIQIEAGSKNEAAEENVEGDAVVVEGNEMMEVVEANDEVEANPKRIREEEINRKAEVKTEVEANQKRSGEDEQGNRKVMIDKTEVEASEMRDLVEGGGIGEVSQKGEKGGAERSTKGSRKRKRKRLRKAEEEATRLRVDQETREMKGEVNEKPEVQLIDKMDVDAIEERDLVQQDGGGVQMVVEERDLVQKDEQDGGGVQMVVEEVTGQKEVAEIANVKLPGSKKSRQRKARQKALRLLEEASQNGKESVAITEHEGQEEVDLKLNGEVMIRKQEEEVNNKVEESKEEEEAIQHNKLGEEAAITKTDELESDFKVKGEVSIQMQEGRQAKQKQEEEVNHKEGQATEAKKKKSKQPKQTQKIAKTRIEKHANQGGKSKQQQKKMTKKQHDLVSVLNQFRVSEDQVYKFDATLNTADRAAVHLLCIKMGLMSKSSGKGNNRCISVYKRKMRGKETRKKNITRFTLSEEAKNVSLNLFTQYPPYDCGMGDKMAGAVVVKTNRRRQSDPYFARPLMSEGDIRKKVESLASKQAKDPKLKQITEKRSKLPIASFRDAITSAIDSHQVVLVSGETGCGKTTQVPQYVLDHVWSKSKTCKIICTQPRRISAVSVAGRIASERGEKIGDSVGYKIKLESEGGRNSSIIFCTTGVLLRVLVAMGNSSLEREASRNRDAIAGHDGITHIIVDEVHERDHFSDLLLAIVRELLPSNPDLRLVLMSATIDAERFSQYFGGCPVIRVPGFTYPVKTLYLEDILSILKSNDNNHLDCASRNVTSVDSLLEKYRAVIDDTITLAWSSDEYEPLLDLVSSEAGPNIFNFQHSSTGVTPLMVFARKGRVGELYLILSLGADCYLQDNDGATALQWAKRENQKEAAEILEKHMEKSTMNNEEEERLVDKYLATVNSELVDFVLIEKLLQKICTDSTDGAILVFLTGWDDIQKTIEKLQRSSFFKDASKFLVLALHSKVPSLEQKKVFERPPPGCRKIILSTNIAESSITIDDVVYVINSGRMKEKSYDPNINVSTLLSSWISKASAKQRAGRAGRCQPGICYHLYSKIRAASFLDFQVPAVKRMPLEELCLQVKTLDPVCKIGDFLGKLLDPPVTQSINNAISVLQELGALSPGEELTALGNKLVSLPVHPILSKMLFFAILLNCLDPALTLACVSTYRDPFYSPMGSIEKKRAMSAKLELASLYGGHGDQHAVIAAFECWKEAQEKGEGASFCKRYFLSPGIMKMVSSMRKKFRSELFRKGFIPEDAPCCNLNAHDPGIRDAVLLAGFYPMVGRLPLSRSGPRALVETAGGVRVRLTSSSANFMLSFDNSEPLVVLDEIIRGDAGLQIKNCNVIGPLPLLLLAKEIIVTPYEDDEDNNGGIESECPGQDTVDGCEVHKHEDSPTKAEAIMSNPGNKVKVIVDRWLTLESTALDVAQIYCLRERLSEASLFKISNPLGTPSKIFDASIHSIARILSYDSRSGIPSTLKYRSPQTSERSATGAGHPELERKEGTSSSDTYLTSLMQHHHVKNYALHHGGKASKFTKRKYALHHGGKASKLMKKNYALHHGGKASKFKKRKRDNSSDQPAYEASKSTKRKRDNSSDQPAYEASKSKKTDNSSDQPAYEASKSTKMDNSSDQPACNRQRRTRYNLRSLKITKMDLLC